MQSGPGIPGPFRAAPAYAAAVAAAAGNFDRKASLQVCGACLPLAWPIRLVAVGNGSARLSLSQAGPVVRQGNHDIT